jgi:formylmethanofuran dehydrogenase subunit B
MYLAAGKGDMVVAGAIAALEADMRVAMGEGLKLAVKNVEKAKKDTAAAEEATEALLKKVVKTWKN